MIVRNESQFLADCLRSIQAVADEILVVDTGSSDDTVAIAREYGAQVTHYSWNDDFAAARNFSIQQAKSAWILWLDADERLMPESQEQLLHLLSQARPNSYYRVTIKNWTKEPGNYLLSTAHRLFPNHQGFKFTGKVHEVIIPPPGKRQYKEVRAPIVIEHLGYTLQGEDAQAKEQRNRQILEKLLQDNPDDFMTNFNYAQHLDIYGHWPAARTYYLKSLQLRRLTPALEAVVYNNLAGLAIRMQDYEAAKAYAEASIKLEPRQVAAYYHLYRRAYTLQAEGEMVVYLQKLLGILPHINPNNPRISADLQLDEDQIRYTLALLLHKGQQWTECRRVLEPLLARKPHDRAVLNLLIDTALRQNDLKSAQQLLLNWQCLEPQNQAIRKMLGNLAIKQHQFTQAITIYETILAANPGDQEAIRRLVGLYGIVGDIERARQLSQQLTSSPSS